MCSLDQVKHLNLAIPVKSIINHPNQKLIASNWSGFVPLSAVKGKCNCLHAKDYQLIANHRTKTFGRIEVFPVIYCFSYPDLAEQTFGKRRVDEYEKTDENENLCWDGLFLDSTH